MSACVECTLDLYPPQVTYPLCTIANTPRLPEHCIEYVKVIQWAKENPWGVAIDGDDPQHISWIYEKSMERALQFNITGLTYRLVQGVVKNIIPAVASTNAVIAAACATEVRYKYRVMEMKGGTLFLKSPCHLVEVRNKFSRYFPRI